MSLEYFKWNAVQVSYIVFVKECLLTAVTPLAQIPHRAPTHPMSPKNTCEPKKASQFLATTLSSEISAKLDYACKKDWLRCKID